MSLILDEHGSDSVDLVSEVFQYRLTWAVEAVRATSLGIGSGGTLASLIEAGVPNYAAAVLLRLGLSVAYSCSV